MSGKVVHVVLRCPKIEQPNDVLLMSALADRSDEWGNVAFEQLDMFDLAVLSRQSYRGGQASIKRMEEAGFLKVVRGNGRGNQTRFYIQVKALEDATARAVEEARREAEAAGEKGAEIAPFSREKHAMREQVRKHKKGENSAPFIEGEKGAGNGEKGCTAEQKRVQETAEKGAGNSRIRPHIRNNDFNDKTRKGTTRAGAREPGRENEELLSAKNAKRDPEIVPEALSFSADDWRLACTLADLIEKHPGARGCGECERAVAIAYRLELEDQRKGGADGLIRVIKAICSNRALVGIRETLARNPGWVMPEAKHGRRGADQIEKATRILATRGELVGLPVMAKQLNARYHVAVQKIQKHKRTELVVQLEFFEQVTG